MTATPCRFSWVTYRCGECESPPLNAEGHAVIYAYFHVPCSRVHWCVPAAEADGTEDDDVRAAVAGSEAAWRAGCTPRGPRPCPHNALNSVVRVRSQGGGSATGHIR
jgi:hypothetical protein